MGGCSEITQAKPGDRAWLAPLTLMVHLAWRAIEGSGQEQEEPGSSSTAAAGAVVWIGRRCWPYVHALVRDGPGPGGLDRRLLDHSLFVDPPNDAARLWATDLALRAGSGLKGRGGVSLVIADASHLDMSGSRRLQLAAEASIHPSGRGGVLGLLVRPPWEHKHLSAAATRWMVHAAEHGPGPPWPSARPDVGRDHPRVMSDGFTPLIGESPGHAVAWTSAMTMRHAAAFGQAEGDGRITGRDRVGPRWSVELLRCKGKQPSPGSRRKWTLELDRARRVVCVPPVLADRPAAPASAAG